MEEKRTIFDYLSQVMVIFGFTLVALNLFCLLFGDLAKEHSTMFAMGSQGVPVATAFEFLAVSVLVVGLRTVFFTDRWIRHMALWLRRICIMGAVMVLIIVFVAVFDWFPVNMWQPWALYLICFGVSFVGSFVIMAVKERMENKHMEEALRRLKEKEAAVAWKKRNREKSK